MTTIMKIPSPATTGKTAPRMYRSNTPNDYAMMPSLQKLNIVLQSFSVRRIEVTGFMLNISKTK